ncbi:hypothetical protein SDC9_158431 [bioreactor metagenome]|uniref:Uncharacterized protein n=1 Tax=bioreactor metagenome TaxID=1076179 RepID=A0A645FB38_9ZZZZ
MDMDFEDIRAFRYYQGISLAFQFASGLSLANVMVFNNKFGAIGSGNFKINSRYNGAQSPVNIGFRPCINSAQAFQAASEKANQSPAAGIHHPGCF